MLVRQCGTCFAWTSFKDQRWLMKHADACGTQQQSLSNWLHKLIETQQDLWSFYCVFVFWDMTAQLQQFAVLTGNSFGKFRWLPCLHKESNQIVGPYQWSVEPWSTPTCKFNGSSWKLYTDLKISVRRYTLIGFYLLLLCHLFTVINTNTSVSSGCENQTCFYFNF